MQLQGPASKLTAVLSPAAKGVTSPGPTLIGISDNKSMKDPARDYSASDLDVCETPAATQEVADVRFGVIAIAEQTEQWLALADSVG